MKQKAFEEAFALLNRQEDSPEHCWHCGRKAVETCSGCTVSRYCSQFCQLRDWDQHQKLCSPDFKRKLIENPLLYGNNKRYFSTTTKSLLASSPLIVTASDSSPTKNDESTTAPNTPLLCVSSPIDREQSTEDNNHSENDDGGGETSATTTSVKTESI